MARPRLVNRLEPPAAVRVHQLRAQGYKLLAEAEDLAAAAAYDVAPAPTPAAPPLRYHTCRAFAELAGVPPRTIAQWCAQGRLDAHRLGVRWRIPSTALGRIPALLEGR